MRMSLDDETNKYKHLVWDLGYGADIMPDVTFTIPGDLLRLKDGSTVSAVWIKREIEKMINNRKEEETMTNEIKRKDLPIDLGRRVTDFDSSKPWGEAIFHPEYVIIPAYERIIFNNPATIILWKDGTKTVVKCGPDDTYDPEKGLAMCLLKKLCGNDGIIFHKTMRKMMKSYEPPVEESEAAADILRRVNEKLKGMKGND